MLKQWMLVGTHLLQRYTSHHQLPTELFSVTCESEQYVLQLHAKCPLCFMYFFIITYMIFFLENGMQQKDVHEKDENNVSKHEVKMIQWTAKVLC